MTAWHPVDDPTDGGGDDDDDDDVKTTTYDLPLITPVIRRSRWTRFIPVCSTFDGFDWLRCREKKHCKSFTPASATTA